ncbi:MAG: cysteine desulfurase family protein [Sphaerobacter sp.]|nr:cysteine desulfurase family protein [Sphaerobacter sp.]
MDTTIYFDYHATTPCDPRVVEAMLPYFTQEFGNPSSGLHRLGRRAARAVETAREQVAALIGATPEEIVFTSGATESNNLVIHGLAHQRSERRRIVTTAIEHKAVLEPCRALEAQGFDVVILPVGHDGTVNLPAAEEAITDDTLLVSVQLASNEIGTIQPLRAIAELARQRGALVHTDAAQAVGKIRVDIDALGVDFLSISGHKLYGPKGIGALFVRSGLRRRLVPLVQGGGHEGGLRPGTLNVPGIVGLGEACAVCAVEMHDEAMRVASLRDQLETRLSAAIPGLQINGNLGNRLPGNSSLTFPAVEADALIAHLPGFALSTGSACTSGAVEPSHVLTAIGLSREAADATIRIGLGRFTTSEEIDAAARVIPEAWMRLALAAS